MAAQFPEIFRLDIADRLQLVEALWDSIAANPAALPVPLWQQEELDRRQASAEQQAAPPIPWDAALNSLRQRRD